MGNLNDVVFFLSLTGNPASGVASARRRPSIDNLYDVFFNVRNDEAEHMKTMQFCQLPGAILRSPSEAAACVVSADQTPSERCVDSYREHTDRTCEGLVDCLFNPGAGGFEAPPAAGGAWEAADAALTPADRPRPGMSASGAPYPATGSTSARRTAIRTSTSCA